MNNTICENSAGLSCGGLAGLGYSVATNNVVWGNWDPWGDPQLGGDSLDVSYCDIQDTLWPGEGNISVDPLFRDPDNGDFHLMATECGDPYNSPCIDAGDPSIFDYLLDCDWGLGYERSDMGAYGGQAIPTDIRERERESDLPKRICMSQNYPNPFNSSTVISYSLPTVSYVTVNIYNVLGQVEETIFEGIQQTGRQSITWNAHDYPSGIYFARVEANNRSGDIRMVLLK